MTTNGFKVNGSFLRMMSAITGIVVASFVVYFTIMAQVREIMPDVAKAIVEREKVANLQYYPITQGFDLENRLIKQTTILEQISKDIQEIKAEIKK